MADWRCGRCRARVAPGAPRCPECPSTEFTMTEAEAGEVLKINRDGIVSDSADVREHPGTGVPMEAVEHPADGTMSPLVGDDEPVPAEVPGDGPVVEEKSEAEEGQASPPAPPAATPPRTPPRRPPAVPRE